MTRHTYSQAGWTLHDDDDDNDDDDVYGSCEQAWVYPAGSTRASRLPDRHRECQRHRTAPPESKSHTGTAGTKKKIGEEDDENN